MSQATPEQDLPPQLSPPASIQARNTEYNLDLIGRVTHLNENGIVASFPVEIPEGTVLFSNIDLRSINSMVRGLVRVRSQVEGLDLGGYSTVADFVDLNEDERRKIRRQMSGEAGSMRAGVGGDAAGKTLVSPGSTIAARPRRRFRLPSLRLPQFSLASIVWFLLGIIFYSALALAIAAIFPQSRAWELAMLQRILHDVNTRWPNLRHLFGLLWLM